MNGWYYHDEISNLFTSYFTKEAVIPLIKKTILLLVILLSSLLGVQVSVQGWFVIEPFYEVKVVQAITFSIKITEVDDSSLLFDKVAISDTVQVYIAYLALLYKGNINGYSAILVLTDESNNKLLTLISDTPTSTNPFPSQLVFRLDLVLDPLKGKYLPSGKGLESVMVRHLFATGFEFIDVNGTTYVMILGSDTVLSELDITVPARERTTSW
ncbi:MAG: hypothetical protein U1C51_05480 [Candidatus Izemoplasmatales bacterium]|nr:hypothetical protein [Candidatus Izemoplasmatales bacterium]